MRFFLRGHVGSTLYSLREYKYCSYAGTEYSVPMMYKYLYCTRTGPVYRAYTQISPLRKRANRIHVPFLSREFLISKGHC